MKKKVKDKLVCYIKHEQMVSSVLQLKGEILLSLCGTSFFIFEIYGMDGHHIHSSVKYVHTHFI